MKELLRHCLKCRKFKPINEFYLYKFSKSGFYHRCKLCTDYHYKLCTKCERFVDRTYFHKNKNHKDKLEYVCKFCRLGSQRPDTYFVAHKTERLNMQKKWLTMKRKVDPFFKLQSSLRSRLSTALKVKKWHVDSKFAEYLGCTKEEFTKHIESLWTEGMSWDNYGRKRNCWSIDHIIPMSTANTAEELIKLFHFKNLQPLWVPENCKKSDKINL